MKLYHGSTVEVEKPDLQKCRSATDFGRAFYTTTSVEQAAQWAKIKQKRANANVAVVSIFEFD
jgi:ribosome-binding protein aMBF1 (putative translation factor)